MGILVVIGYLNIGAYPRVRAGTLSVSHPSSRRPQNDVIGVSVVEWIFFRGPFHMLPWPYRVGFVLRRLTSGDT